MKLRARLLVTLVALAVPIALGLTVFAFTMRRQAVLDSTWEATVARAEAMGPDGCLERPRRFRRRRGPRRLDAYDDAFTPQLGSPPLDADLRRTLEGGERVAGRWMEPDRVRVAMRMPWDGPCAVIAMTRPVGEGLGTRGFLMSLAWSALVALLMAGAALIAMGPVVRRIRRLTESVRAQRSGGYEGDVAVAGSDEIAELARAFNEASAEIRGRLEELSARDEALTEFLSSTTHDVMIPLTVLGGHLSDLADAVDAGEPADATKVHGALQEAHYLTSLMKNLSAAARMDAGEPMLRRHAFDLREVVERVVTRHRPVARREGVSIEYAVPDDAVEVHADSTLAEQALNNLVSNAVKYNEDGGHVAVILEAKGGGFEVRVLDDGPGIPEEELARVAERRFRGGAARQRQPTGLGLGLHIVRDVADKHGWTLAFENVEPHGLEVTLRG